MQVWQLATDSGANMVFAKLLRHYICGSGRGRAAQAVELRDRIRLLTVPHFLHDRTCGRQPDSGFSQLG